MSLIGSNKYMVQIVENCSMEVDWMRNTVAPCAGGLHVYIGPNATGLQS
jgi:hypothetical protein